jgi:siroheme synthase-like protein
MSLMIELLPAAGPALVVGGGVVAERKVRALVEAGFCLSVIAPVVSEAIRAAGVDLQLRPFEEGDVEGHAVVFACTDVRDVNRSVGEAARRRCIPVVVADSQEESTFFTPATHRDGDLAIAVSTHGASPGLAREVRDRIAGTLGTGWGERVASARAQRQSRLAAGRNEVADG